MEVGLVRSIDIDREMQQAYLDYAMSVIVARALPDARDGLKPVHRRILYAMYDMNLGPDSAYKKSARIVGEVLGKYHPHGDIAVYESMARMAQDFSMRYQLVDGQGNFGSVDGDPPAAMRYTEARLTSPASHLLADIDKNTVDFSDNFDGSLTEPDVLPSAIPNMLVNGATGIAVGMSTSIPPHNLAEVVDALTFMLHRWEELDDINVEDLMRFIQGPDFPTGGVIIQEPGEEEGLTSAYGSGRGKVVVQARAHFEEMSRGRNRIIVTELPYMTNKSSLIERIAELVRDGRMEGIADLRDESDRQGLRIVIELTKTADPETVLNVLYKNTQMRSTFGIIMLALVDGEPRMLSLKQSLRVYLDHRLVVIRRRSEFELERARQRAHIIEGLRVALKNLDMVIDLIRKAPDVDTARARLMKRFRLSDIQAQAILDMPLRRLAALERKKIEDEYKEILVKIKTLEALLRSPKKMRDVVADELRVVKDAYTDRRRTQIINLGKRRQQETPFLMADLAPEREVWVSVTPQGLISRTLDERLPRFSGRDTPTHLIRANTRDTLYLVTEQGEAAGVPVHAIPEVEEISNGIPLYKASALSENDKLAVLFTLPPKDDRADGWFVFTATRQGLVKKTALSELPGPTARTFVLVKVNEGDRLGWVRLTNGKADILLATEAGMAIRFPEEEVRPMGLVAAGVGGIKLQAKDEVVGMEPVPSRGEILFLTSDGRGKRIAAAQFPVQGRYGQGVVAWKLPRTARLVSTATGKDTTHLIVLMDKLAPKSIRLDEAALQNRSALGKPVIPIKSGDKVISLVIPIDVPRPLVKEKGGSRAATVPSGDIKEADDLIQKSELKHKPVAIAVPAPRKSSSARKSVKEVKPAIKPPKSKITSKPLSKGKVTTGSQKSKTSQKPAQEKLPRRRKPKARLAASMASHKPSSISKDLTVKGTVRSAPTKKPATKTASDKKSPSASSKATTPGKTKPKAGTRTSKNSSSRKGVSKQIPLPLKKPGV